MPQTGGLHKWLQAGMRRGFSAPGRTRIPARDARTQCSPAMLPPATGAGARGARGAPLNRAAARAKIRSAPVARPR